MHTIDSWQHSLLTWCKNQSVSCEQPLTAVLLNVLTATPGVSMDSQMEKDSQQTVVMEEALQQDQQESQQSQEMQESWQQSQEEMQESRQRSQEEMQDSQQQSQEEMQEPQQPPHQEPQEGANSPEATSKEGKREEEQEEEEWPPKFPTTLAEFGYHFNKGEPSAKVKVLNF